MMEFLDDTVDDIAGGMASGLTSLYRTFTNACIWFWFLTWRQKFYLFIILSCMAAVARVCVYVIWS